MSDTAPRCVHAMLRFLTRTYPEAVVAYGAIAIFQPLYEGLGVPVPWPGSDAAERAKRRMVAIAPELDLEAVAASYPEAEE